MTTNNTPTNQAQSLPHGNHFTNPYNFVSWELPVNEKKYRRSYAPLDRYYGYSGQIECSLKTLTPFFVPSGQPEKQQVADNGHKTKAFLRLPHPETGEPVLAVQATSLKGMVRNIVEAATNSCYAVFDPDQHYSYRPLPKPLPIGMIHRDGEKWSLEKMESARVNLSLLGSLGEIKPVEKAIARIDRNRKNSFLIDAVEIRLWKEGAPIPPGFTKGWLRATGKGLIENKRNEKFVYQTNGLGQKYQIPDEVVKAYDAVLKEQLERDGQGERTYNTKLPNYELTPGDIVYFEEEFAPKGGTPGKVKFLGAVAVPRYQYKNSVGNYLRDIFKPCESVDCLCPACRLFGWVSNAHPEPGKKEAKDKTNPDAIAGRVFFSHAYFNPAISRNSSPEECTLAILSSPKPTTTPFYLLNNDLSSGYADYNDKPGNPPKGSKAEAGSVWIRGRKFYWHHQPRDHQYLQPAKGDRTKLDQKNDQNSTVELLGNGHEFKFTIEFMNLDKAELGMLLWALEFDGEDSATGQQLRHKLGMGKPLGLGSIQVKVEKLVLHDRVQRYRATNLFNPPTAEVTNRAEFRESFKAYMQEVFGKPFDELWNVKDLKAMLNFNSIKNPLEVHYPHLPDLRQPELPDKNVPESFRWFVRNNRRLNIRKNNYPYVLPTPDEEIEIESLRLPTNP